MMKSFACVTVCSLCPLFQQMAKAVYARRFSSNGLRRQPSRVCRQPYEMP